MDAREVALLTLNACHRQGGWSDQILKKQLAAAGLDSRDGALATQLCFGVLQNQILLDFYLSQFSNLPLKKMEGKVLQALRLGAYQILFLDKIPASAAVNRSVELTKAHCKNPRAAGMVNGILRNLARRVDSLPTIPKARYLSTLYSHPVWLVQEMLMLLGTEETAALLAANNGRPPVTGMVNTLRTTAGDLSRALEEEGVEVSPHPWLSHCLTLNRTGELERLDAFQKGLFYIQDPASRLAVEALDPVPGMRVLDCCAAPGGKTFGIALAMGDRGEVVSCDLHPHKKGLIRAGAERLGLKCVSPRTADGTVFCPEWEGAFDRVLVDAPCSGLGVIRKKPDIRYKDPGPLSALPEVQGRILANAARYVRPGGALVYSTCTLLRRETEELVTAFLKGNDLVRPEPFSLPGPVGAVESGMVTLWPQRHGTDGFFICKLRREG